MDVSTLSPAQQRLYNSHKDAVITFEDGGDAFPFLFSHLGLRRVRQRGRDPVAAAGGLIGVFLALWGDEKVELDDAPSVIFERLRPHLTGEILDALYDLAWAGFLTFDGGRDGEALDLDTVLVLIQGREDEVFGALIEQISEIGGLGPGTEGKAEAGETLAQSTSTGAGTPTASTASEASTPREPITSP